MESNEIVRPTETESDDARLVQVGQSDERDFGVEVRAQPAAVQVPLAPAAPATSSQTVLSATVVHHHSLKLVSQKEINY